MTVAQARTLAAMAATLIILSIAMMITGCRDNGPTPARYRSCNEASALGKAPITTGQPGYRIGLDRDQNGIACE